MTDNVRLTHSFSALKTFQNCALRYYYERISKEVKDTGNAATIWGNRVHSMLENRLKDTDQVPADHPEWEVLCNMFEQLPGTLHTELEMTLTEQLEPTGWWADDAWMRLKADVLVVNAPTALVADWKTGKRRPDFDQLELTALMTFKFFPEVDEVKACFVWLNDLQMDSETYTRAQAPALWEKFLTKTRRIEMAQENNIWPANPSGLCNWCSAQHMCKYRR